MEVFEIRLREGILIKGRRFPAEHPRFNLLIQTGMCEHGGRYEEFARFLNKKGFDVSVMDAFSLEMNTSVMSQDDSDMRNRRKRILSSGSPRSITLSSIERSIQSASSYAWLIAG